MLRTPYARLSQPSRAAAGTQTDWHANSCCHRQARLIRRSSQDRLPRTAIQSGFYLVSAGWTLAPNRGEERADQCVADERQDEVVAENTIVHEAHGREPAVAKSGTPAADRLAAAAKDAAAPFSPALSP